MKILVRKIIAALVILTLYKPQDVMAQNEYIISIDLAQSKEEVWNAITDFQSYSKWNTVLSMRDNDQLAIGKKFSVTIHHNGKDSKFKATTLSKEVNRSFAAQQRIIGKWFFSATHYFIIEESSEPEGHVRFIQKWHLTGLIAKLFKKQIFQQLVQFKRMNDELEIYLGKYNLKNVAKADKPD